MIPTIIKVSIALILLASMVGWTVMHGIISDQYWTYRFPTPSPYTSPGIVQDLRSKSDDMKRAFDTLYVQYLRSKSDDMKRAFDTLYVQHLRFRMLSTDHDLPVFVATLVRQHGGEAALDIDFPLPWTSTSRYIIYARVPPALASNLTSVDGNDPASVQVWLDQQYMNQPEPAASDTVPVRIAFIGPHVKIMSTNFDSTWFPAPAIVWAGGAHGILFCIWCIIGKETNS